MQYLIIIAAAVVSYLIGSINFSILISKAISGEDIRKSGSGNAGATNMLRTHGKKMGILTLLLDVLKGVVVILLTGLAINLINKNTSFDIDVNTIKYIAGVAVVIGHNFPLYFGFKGGKGVATSLGVVLMLDWKIGLLVLAIAIIIMAVTHYVSLGSVLGGIVFIGAELIGAFITHEYNAVKIVCVVVLGGLLVARHHANIKRLISGTENKLSFGKKN